MTKGSNHNRDDSQQRRSQTEDSDEIRELIQRGLGEEEETTDFDPSIFDSNREKSWISVSGYYDQPQPPQRQVLPQLQQTHRLIQPQLHYQRSHSQTVQSTSSPKPPELSSIPQLQRKQLQMAWQQSQMNTNEPFAALMSASTAAAAMDGNIQDNDMGLGDAMATAAALAAGDHVKVGASPASNAIQNELSCVRCSYPGCDVRILCPKQCTYHARCIDLISIVNSQQQRNTNAVHAPQGSSSVMVHSCPYCSSPANGLEILPLSFEDMDRAQKMNQGRMFDAADRPRMDSEDSRKRSNSEIVEGKSNNTNMLLSSTPPVSSYSQSSSQCYDPSVPRTGRWTDEELAFRDCLIAHFLEGSMPLSNGLKLNDFLSNILKSKQSRLTKKMKHAKLSTKYFHIKRGFLFDDSAARDFSRLEYSFIHVITDPIERSEIQFHMQREWREHLAERCSYLRIIFDGSAWVNSVEKCEQRVALDKNRTKMMKRHWMMGKAMEKDVCDKIPGVFIEHGTEPDDMMAGFDGGDGDFGRFLMSILDEGGNNKNFEHPTASNGILSAKKAAFRSTVDPNFKSAAPFLSGIMSYIEKNAIPFEHADLWVPSFTTHGESQPGSMGSGSNPEALANDDSESQRICRLCYAGSATVSQVVSEKSTNEGWTSSSLNADKNETVKPLSSDEFFNFSLFGDYSEKFSFNSGCGLPGRVFQSGIAAWEQFVTNAPSHLFERTGGAVQFGIRTALGLPIESPNVGRIVLILYSKYNREKNEELVKQIVSDLRLFNPSPRWKLVVDINSSKSEESANPLIHPGNAQVTTLKTAGQATNQQPAYFSNPQAAALSTVNLTAVAATTTEGPALSENSSKTQIMSLISLLGESMPSDATSPLGQQLNDLMSLRLVLLRQNRTPDEQQLVDTILLLFESYMAAGRSRQDIAILLCRDFMFHNQQTARVSILQQQQRSLTGQKQQLQGLNQQQTGIGLIQNSFFQSLGGLSHALPSTHSLAAGQQALPYNNALGQLALHQHQQQQAMQQLTLPQAYLGMLPGPAKDDESLGTNSAGGGGGR